MRAMKVEREVTIAAPPAAVYEVIMDPRRLQDWVTIQVSLENAPPGNLKKGSELTQRLKLAGQAFSVSWKIVENDPVRRVVWLGRGPMRSKASVTYELEPAGEGTRFSYANEYSLPGGPLGRMAGPVVRRVTASELEDSLARLRTIVEGQG